MSVVVSFYDQTRPTKTLTDREQALLLKTTGEHKRADAFRDHCIFSLALATGLREHEIAALNVEDLLHQGGVRRVLRLKVFKRSNDDPQAQEIVMNDTVRAKLKALIGSRKEGPVFMTRLGTRISTRMLRYAFRSWQVLAGIETPRPFHSLRHTACTNLYRDKKDPSLVQRFARHASSASTSRYTHASDEDLHKAVQKLFC